MASFKLSDAADEDVSRLYRFGIERFGLTRANGYYDGPMKQLSRIAADPALYPRVDNLRA